MRLIKTELTKLERVKDCGILQFRAIYDIAKENDKLKVDGGLEYTGPKIPPDEWRKSLAFLKWVYDTTKSEAQLRWYVNTKTNTWAAWAYPQEANGGMSAREIDNEEASEQRKQFKDSDGWIYLMTQHSHCDAGAFQSSTDESNERNQDGLHITVGHLGRTKYDLHARFYFGRDLFETDMALFWDIGSSADGLSPALKAVLKDGWEDKLAREQMSEPPTDFSFPEEWKANIIEKPRVQTYGEAMSRSSSIISAGGKNFMWSHQHSRYVQCEWDSTVRTMVPLNPMVPMIPDTQKTENPAWEKRRGKKDKRGPIYERKKTAFEGLLEIAKTLQSTEAELGKELEYMAGYPIICAVVQQCKDFDLVPSDLMDEFDWHEKVNYNQFDHEQGGLKMD
jgi:hypothetical protein